MNTPFDVNFEKQLIKKEAEKYWENLMEHADRRKLEPEFVYGELLKNLNRLARKTFLS